MPKFYRLLPTLHSPTSNPKLSRQKCKRRLCLSMQRKMPQELHRTRSRSPHRSERRSKNRSRSPHDRHRRVKPRVERKALPFGARDLSRYDLSAFRPMFALYLDIQKQIYIDDLDEKEVKGRWKSFVGKW